MVMITMTKIQALNVHWRSSIGTVAAVETSLSVHFCSILGLQPTKKLFCAVCFCFGFEFFFNHCCAHHDGSGSRRSLEK